MMHIGRTTLLAVLLTIFFSACSESASEETTLSKEELIDAVEANAEEAPATAIEEMKQEIEEAAETITEEVPVVTNGEATNIE